MGVDFKINDVDVDILVFFRKKKKGLGLLTLFFTKNI